MFENEISNSMKDSEYVVTLPELTRSELITGNLIICVQLPHIVDIKGNFSSKKLALFQISFPTPWHE